jgi:hypothetical protein
VGRAPQACLLDRRPRMSPVWRTHAPRRARHRGGVRAPLPPRPRRRDRGACSGTCPGTSVLEESCAAKSRRRGVGGVATEPYGAGSWGRVCSGSCDLGRTGLGVGLPPHEGGWEGPQGARRPEGEGGGPGKEGLKRLRPRPRPNRARIRSAARRAASRSPSIFVPACSASSFRSFSTSVPSSGSMMVTFATRRPHADALRASLPEPCRERQRGRPVKHPGLRPW